MFIRVAIAVLAASVALAGTACHNEPNQASLTVHTKTGTFIGGLNDTYPDVRYFKYIPYAKVRRISHLSFTS